MNFRVFLLMLTLLPAFQTVEAQSYLLLRKKGSMRRYTYFKGDELVYKQKGYDTYFRDRIMDFADSTIVLKNNIILVSQLEVVDVRKARTNRAAILRKAENTLPALGVGLFAIDLANNLIDGSPLTLDQGVTTAAGAMAASGFTLHWIRRKYIRLNKPKFEAFIVIQ